MTQEITHGHLTLLPEENKVLWKGTPITFTPRQFRVVHALVNRAGVPLSFRHVYDIFTGRPGTAAGSDEQGYAGNVRALMVRVRHAFTMVDREFDEIQTLTDLGYQWRRSGVDAGAVT